MIKITNYLLLTFLIIFFGACKTTQKQGDQLRDKSNEKIAELQKDAPLESALLWKIEGNGLQEHSYLFGTIHMIEKESFFWPKGTLSAFDESEDVVFEVDLDDMFDVSSQMGLLTKAFMKDDQKLADFYSAEDYEKVKSHFDGMGIPMFFLEKIKPMFLTVFAGGDIEMGSGFGEDSSIKSYEMELYSLSQESNKDVAGLESIEFQISVFDSIPYQAQADMLLQTIESGDTEDDSFKEMVEMYTSQDINKMISSMSDEESGIADYEDLLLNQRNKNWIPVMAEKMSTTQTFFAVGAGHLAGEEGVIRLLQKEGYKLTPLSQDTGM